MAPQDFREALIVNNLQFPLELINIGETHRVGWGLGLDNSLKEGSSTVTA
jgi:hypothetical protein